MDTFGFRKESREDKRTYYFEYISRDQKTIAGTEGPLFATLTVPKH